MEKEITLFFNTGAYDYFIAQFCIAGGLGGLGAIAAAILTKRRPTPAAYQEFAKKETTEAKKKEKREELDAFYKSLVSSCLVLAFSVICILAHTGSILTGFTGVADFFSAEGAAAAGVTMSNRVADSFGNLHSLLYIPVGLILLHEPVLRFAMALLFRHTMVSSVINAALGLGFAVTGFWVYLNPYGLQMIELVIVLTGIFLFQNIYTAWYARFINWGGVACMLLMIVMELATGVLLIVCGNYFYLFSAGHFCYILGPMAVVMTAALLVFAIMLGNKFLPKNLTQP